ncbi:hypothetical protein [Pseudodesulfovibrio sp.]|uniref:hypothetical protein n=1 Tax=unclassified Pseudodesulfovibrio TaxID=2661612 RepID=UPI003B00F11D
MDECQGISFEAIAKPETESSYGHGPRYAAQIQLQYELGLRREESAKVDLVVDGNRGGRILLIQHGPKGHGWGRLAPARRRSPG